MKKLAFVLVILISNVAWAQTTEYKKLPSVDLKTLDGKTINTSTIMNDGKPIVISFWATWCKPCIKELTAIAEDYQDIQKETGVKIYAVSIDDARSSGNVAPLVNGKNWEYDILLDGNGDFKRAMNINLVPHVILINGKGEIVWQHSSYQEGGEQELYEKIREASKN